MKRLSTILFGMVFPFICYAADIHLTQQTFSDLPGWQQANVVNSLEALQKSCQVMTMPNAETTFSTPDISLKQADWQTVCQAAMGWTNNSASARAFFQKYFQPYSVSSSQGERGLFTGYYLPQVQASLTKTSIYNVPIFARPKDLATIKLGLFNSAWQGKTISGRLMNGRVYPYNITRKQIDFGAIDKTVPVIVWVKSNADRFFLQVQGSGIAILPDGKKLLLGYDGDNGQAYYPIGRWFISQHIYTRDNISMQKIHDWLLIHPDQANKVMEMDPSFVFMKVLSTTAPLGTQKVPLTDGYSLAVDNSLIPLGAPLWLVTEVPNPTDPKLAMSFNRLMIAQDTGGAIKGAVRGDIYFGSGKSAEVQAGHMQNSGQYWILLPKNFNSH